MADFPEGSKWTFFGPSGPRRYMTTGSAQGPPGTAVTLACLEPPLPAVEGYKGAGSGEARILSQSLQEGRDKKTGRGWAPGHVTA